MLRRNTPPLQVDLGINVERKKNDATGSLDQIATIVDIGDLSTFTALEEDIDAHGAELRFRPDHARPFLSCKRTAAALQTQTGIMAHKQAHRTADAAADKALHRRQSEFEAEAFPHKDILYNFALRTTGDADDAKDLLQETFMKAYRFWDKYEKGTNIARGSSAS